MPSLLALRYYSHARLNHSHVHAPLVFDLSNQLDVEVAGLGRDVLCTGHFASKRGAAIHAGATGADAKVALASVARPRPNAARLT